MSLINIHKSKTGKLSDKWESYLHVYEDLFSPIKDKAVTLVELGVQNGGSLETWSEYFINAIRIVGVDIDIRCSQLKFLDPKIEVHIQDSKVAIPGKYDVIIDDGSHGSDDIIQNFKSWFPYLNVGGIYIVEDLHAMWMGGYFGTGAQKFFGDMITDVNREFHSEKSYEIHKLEFYNSLAVLYKGPALLGGRLRCGTEQII